MMGMFNNVTVIGNLVSDPVLTVTSNDKVLCKARVAVNEPYQMNGEWHERTSYVNVVTWDGLAENIAASFGTGDRVIVVGRIDVRDYTTEDGSRAYSTEITATEFGASVRRAYLPKIERVKSPVTV
jgi:single-strand DNA-binding protein